MAARQGKPELLLDVALRAGFLPESEALITRGAPWTTPPLQAAAWSLSPALVQHVYNCGWDTQVTAETGEAACFTRYAEPDAAGRLEVLVFLLEHGLPAASIALEAVKRLPAVVRHMVSCGLFGEACFAAAAPFMELQHLYHPYTMALLPDGSNALFHAVATRDMDALQAAIAAGGAVDARLPYFGDNVGSPLQYACSLGNLAAARTLVDAGADPAACKACGESIVGCAAESGSLETLLYVLRVAPQRAVTAVKVTRRNQRITPLLAAVLTYARAPAVRALLLAGACADDVLDTIPVAAYPVLILKEAAGAAAAAQYTVETAKAVVDALTPLATRLNVFVPRLNATPLDFIRQHLG